jgi:hypothetical protein
MRILQTVLVGVLVVFELGFSHASMAQQPMPGMQGMPDHGDIASLQCQIFCATAITSRGTILSTIGNQDKDPLPYFTLFTAASVAYIALTFIVKRLHLLSSWRPPDRTLLCGHYSDGL